MPVDLCQNKMWQSYSSCIQVSFHFDAAWRWSLHICCSTASDLLSGHPVKVTHNDFQKTGQSHESSFWPLINLFSLSVNVGCGPAEERVLLTGLHAVADIYCENCKTTLGWKYVSWLSFHYTQIMDYYFKLLHFFSLHHNTSCFLFQGVALCWYVLVRVLVLQLQWQELANLSCVGFFIFVYWYPVT